MERVILVDADDQPIDTEQILAAHGRPGRLIRAAAAPGVGGVRLVSSEPLPRPQ